MHRISVLATMATAGLIAATPATAATPVAGALYGGGASTTDGDHAEYTTVRVEKSGKTLNFYGEWRVRCDGGGQDLAYVTAEHVRLKRNGAFSGKGTIKASGPLGSQAGRFRFSGRFGARHVVRGTAVANLQQTLTAGGGAACTTGRFRFTAIDATQRGAVATPKPGAQYYGSTSQTYPALLRLDAGGTSLRYASLEYELPCEGQEQPLFLDERMPGQLITLGPDGRFSGTETFTSTATVAGNPLEITAHLDGAFANGRLTGAWKLTGRILDAQTGAQIATCTSEDITFAAARG
jgi:hypothetical protein